MDALENERRLTKVEERSKSNSHRLDELEPVIKEIHTMSMTMVELVHEVKHTNETVMGLDKKVDRIDGRVDKMEMAPAEEYKGIKKSIADKVIGGIVAFILSGILWAAVQMF